MATTGADDEASEEKIQEFMADPGASSGMIEFFTAYDATRPVSLSREWAPLLKATYDSLKKEQVGDSITLDAALMVIINCVTQVFHFEWSHLLMMVCDYAAQANSLPACVVDPTRCSPAERHRVPLCWGRSAS